MKIKVALYSMDKRCEDRMLTIFKMNFNGQCEIVDVENADTVIIDMDQKNAQTEILEFRTKHPKIPVIIMAIEPVELNETIYISKPAKLAELLDAIKKSSNIEINSNLNSAANTHSAANALQNRSQSPVRNKSVKAEDFELYYNPENFLQGKIVRAIHEGNKIQKSMFLKCWKDHWIVTFPDSDSLLRNVGDKKIQTLGLVPLGDKEEQFSYSENQFLDNEILLMSETPAENVKLTPIEQFLWNLTVKTARGRVPKGTSLDDLYVIQYWPNIPQLMYTPNAMRISAFWVDRAQSINNVVSKLGIPQEDVLTYFSAAQAIGIAKLAKRKEDLLTTPEIVKSDKKKRGIFSSLFNKISSNIKHNKNTEEFKEAG